MSRNKCIFLFVLLSVTCLKQISFGENEIIMKLINESMAYEEKGETDKAIIKLLEALKFDSKNPLVYRGLGFMYDKKGLYIKASQSYSKAFDFAENDEARRKTSFLIYQSIEKFRSASVVEEGTLVDERLQKDIMQLVIINDKAFRPNDTARLVNQKVIKVTPVDGQQGIYEILEEWIIESNSTKVPYIITIIPSKQGGSDFIVKLKE